MSGKIYKSVVRGYNIIDIRKYPILQELRDDLFNKNNQAFKLMDKLDDSGLLMNECVYNYDIITSEELKNPDYILFSSDTPTETYGKYNIGDIIKAICTLLSDIINSSLDKKHKKELIDILYKLLGVLMQFDKIDELSEEVSVINKRMEEIDKILDDYDIDKDTIKDVLASKEELEITIAGLKFTQSIGGVYVVNDDVGQYDAIILFLNNILGKQHGNELFDKKELYDSYSSINKNIEKIYAHELFHMIHLGMEVMVENNDYADSVVVEGLARYFEVMYSEKYLGTNSIHELELLKEHSVIFYPYTGACYINRYPENRFGEIVDKSIKRHHRAVHSLLQGTKELDIIIKNL